VLYQLPSALADGQDMPKIIGFSQTTEARAKVVADHSTLHSALADARASDQNAAKAEHLNRSLTVG
jgi:hypothetical protein